MIKIVIEPAKISGELILRLLIALLSGALIGLERERARLPVSVKDVPGLRTSGLVSTYGALLGILSSLNQKPLPKMFLITITSSGALGFLILYFIYLYQRAIKRGYTGLTTFIVMLLTFIIGYLSGIGLIIEAISTSILVTLILSLKAPIEKLIESISYNELLSLLEVSTLAIVIGPIIYAFNIKVLGIDLFKVYIFFVIVLSLSFLSYIASKLGGTKGFKLASVLSGLVSSEAAIGASSEIISVISNEKDKVKYASIASSLIISAMELKTLSLTIIAIYIFTGLSMSPKDLLTILLSIIPPLLVLLISMEKELPVEGFNPQSPLALRPAIKTALAYFGLTFAVKIASFVGGNISVFIAAIGGLANATASILGLASSYPQLSIIKIIAGSLLSIATASLNKIIYADSSLMGKKAWRSVMLWSILLAVVPLSIGLLYLYI